jgi:hypothetical protein
MSTQLEIFKLKWNREFKKSNGKIRNTHAETKSPKNNLRNPEKLGFMFYIKNIRTISI